MEKLSELVKLAKRATSGEWNAFISAGGDGTFSIHTPDDSRKGNVVNWPGFDTANCSKAQKKANAKYIAAAHPGTIIAIAEAFRALEQRLKAAIAEVQRINATAQPVSDGWVTVPRSLTAENGAKAALLGEFSVQQNITCHECFGEGCDDCSGQGNWTNNVPVDWTTIKEIWAKGVEHFLAAAPGGQDD